MLYTGSTMDQELLKQIIEWVIGAGIALTITATVIIKFSSRRSKVTQKSKGDNSPNVNIGSITNHNTKDDV